MQLSNVLSFDIKFLLLTEDTEEQRKLMYLNGKNIK